MHPAPRVNVTKGVECSEPDVHRMILFSFGTSKRTYFFIELRKMAQWPLKSCPLPDREITIWL